MPWWDELFGSEGWEAVQLGWGSAEDAADQAERVVEALRLSPGDLVVDAPCGAARLAIELAALGVRVWGVDLSSTFVEAGRERAADRGVEVDLRVGDLREPLGSTDADAVLCAWGSFGYFDDAGNLAQARAAADALGPGGRYLIDTEVAEGVLTRFRPKDWFRVGDTLVTVEADYVAGTGRIESEWTFVRGGTEVGTERSSVRVYTVRELTDLLHQAGFGSFEIRDDALEPFGLGARLWLVATKGA
jgi:SAM-dependent methyltransferase